MGTCASAAIVAGIALYARLCGVALKSASACRVNAFYCKTQLSRLTLVQDPAVVIAVAVLCLDALLNALTHLMRGAEIKRSTLNLVNVAERYSGVVNTSAITGLPSLSNSSQSEAFTFSESSESDVF